MKVLFLPEVENYLYQLIEILYEKEYFGLKESAIKYVVDLEEDIRINLPNKIKRPAPPYFDKYGTKLFFSTFKKNKATQWFVFFDIYEQEEDLLYLVRYISNNHIAAQHIQ